VARREERLVGAGLLFVPADARKDGVDVVLLERVVERDSLQEVVADVGVEQEREGVLLVLQQVPHVVLVVLRERVDRDVVARFEAVLVDVVADVPVTRPDDVEVPFVGPVLAEVDEFVEVLVVVDEDDRGTSRSKRSATSLTKYSVSVESLPPVHMMTGLSYCSRPSLVTSMAFSILWLTEG